MQMLWVAVSWDLYLATHSAVALGNVGLAQVAPFLLFALFAGHVADRYNRRNTVLTTQAIFLASSLALVVETRSVPAIYTCLFLNATARAFQGPARLAVLPLVVPGDDLSNAITWTSSFNEIASVSGPALAGILLAWRGSRIVYIVQAGCAAFAYVCYLLMHFRHERTETVAPMPPREAIVEGVRFVWRDKLILSAISLDMFAVLFGGATALLPIFSVDILHGGPHTLGWLRAAPSIGAVAMALVLAHRPRIREAGKTLLWAVLGYGIATIGFGLSRSLWLSFALLVVTGMCDNISVVLRHSLVQRETPDRVRGRVLAVNNIFISCSNQLGAVESGLTAAWLGAVRSVVFGGMATIAVVAAFARVKPLREWKQ
jgi:MFS family permease